ncbi:MAG: YraN family protein [Desulfobacterota bacterium]|nr:YraN family protein [Thermodesulfobacteriota bacterium]
MTISKKSLGAIGEQLAIDFLKKNDYRIVCQNYRCPFGEIDIIALKKDVLSFIEVKTRRSEQFGHPQEAIHGRKQHHIAKVALAFIQRYRLQDKKAQFDVVAVYITRDGHRIEFIQNAFDLPLHLEGVPY